MDFSNKKIILIHGLASKPPRENVHELWTKCIIENIRVLDPEIAADLEQNDVFESAYWANKIPHHIEDDSDYVRKLIIQVDKVIDERKEIKKDFHVGKGELIGDFFKDRGLDLVKVLAGALTIKDNVMKSFLRETELYDEDQYIADQIRGDLETALRNSWDEGKEVAILSHSMGTFIAYDVLWRFSHRNTPGFEEYNNKRVKLFVTMGSPLGEPAVRNLLFSRHHKNHGKRQFPTNIDFWHNYACLGDVVAHQHNFEEIFFDDMRKQGLFPENKEYRARDYENLHNPFEVVSHDGNKNKEKRNPHKSYGYLVQPRLGSWLIDFVSDRLED